MIEKDSNEELLSRRQFFKQAAKKALPILGAIALLNVPFISKAAETAAMSCKNGCDASCMTSCRNACSGACDGGCSSTCKGSCHNTCNTTCKYHTKN